MACINFYVISIFVVTFATLISDRQQHVQSARIIGRSTSLRKPAEHDEGADLIDTSDSDSGSDSDPDVRAVEISSPGSAGHVIGIEGRRGVDAAGTEVGAAQQKDEGFRIVHPERGECQSASDCGPGFCCLAGTRIHTCTRMYIAKYTPHRNLKVPPSFFFFV